MNYNQQCPACQSTDITFMLDMGQQPLSLLDLQTDPEDSKGAILHSTLLYICENCGHVHNVDFNNSHLSYSQAGCRMYNDGSGWQDHVYKVREIVERVPNVDVMIEIGAGDCGFLHSIKTDANKLAVDPCEAVLRAEELGIDYIRDYFNPKIDMAHGDQSTLIIMRHLLEHMTFPRMLIEPIVHQAKKLPKPTYLFIEVPCCQNALMRRRVEDWTYEHPQHFTVNSMVTLLRNCGVKYTSCETAYNGEVLIVLAKIEPESPKGTTVKDIVEGYKKTAESVVDISRWVEDNIDRVAFWGGSGKSVLLLNTLRVPDNAMVVDSHDEKWGFCVPGTGIKMRPPSDLKDSPRKYIIATTSWRAEDIRAEIVRCGIPCEMLLKFENGSLVEVPLGQEQN